MFLKPANQCAHDSCIGRQLPPEGYFGGWDCQCPCHKLSGKERDEYIEQHPSPIDRIIQGMTVTAKKKLAKPIKKTKEPALPPNCRPATLVSIQLTIGQEKVIRKSFAFALMGDVAKTVQHFVQCAVINEAIEQTGKRKT